MTPKSIQLKKKDSFFLFLFVFLGAIFLANAQTAVPFTPRLEDDNIKVKGDLTLLSNNILNTRVHNNTAFDPNTAFNNRGNNQSFPMAYIDIDDDSSTFSSSSASLNAPECSRVIYAGLYWGGTYPYNEGNWPCSTKVPPISNCPATDPDRDQPYESVKFKVPGGTYVDIGPNSPAIFEYERIYDRNGDRDQDGNRDAGILDVDLVHEPYLNYANVTHLLTPLGEDPNGEYTVANVVGSLERKAGGSLAGWTLVIIYENQEATSKYISTFDGFAAIASGRAATFSFSGFKTLPAPFPVRASIGVSAMEGDQTSSGPQIRFKADSNNSYTVLSNTLNPSRNFFNSTISDRDSHVLTRNPASTNTLGWDTDLIALNNPLNSVLPNGETAADINIRLTNGADIAYLFLNTIAVDIIEPEIIVEKRVEDLAGNDITGDGVNLGQTINYVLSFRNRGNDDAQNFTIRDVLPTNTNFSSIDVTGAPGVTFEEDNGEVTFDIPDNLVEEGDPEYEIRLRVQIKESCLGFVNACTNIIENIAYSTYTGTLNVNPITDDPSVSALSDCGIPTPGATNFILDDISNCKFEKDVLLCGDNVVLDSGDGFDAYTWVRDTNGNKTYDDSDTEVADGNPDNDPSTLQVDQVGVYIVKKEAQDPCKDFFEVFVVKRFGETQTNPIVQFFNTVNGDTDPSNDINGEIMRCSVDGDELPLIYLCGANDSSLLNLPITDAESMAWEKLDENSCADSGAGCANKNGSCTWSEVDSGSSFTADEQGRYRLSITYQNGCVSRFYFDVYQNGLEIQYNKNNIFCETDGSITITNLGNNYGFQLVDATDDSILVPFSDDNGPNFEIAQNGVYRVEIVQLNPTTGGPIPNSCVFKTEDIGVLKKELELDLSTEPENCHTKGSINVQAKDVRPNYNYYLYMDDGTPGEPDGTLVDSETAQNDNNYTFENLNPGNYVVMVKTEDGCEEVETIEVTKVPDLSLSGVTTKHIGCSAGTITLTPEGGFADPNYAFAIWSKDGTDLYATVNDIPADAYQPSAMFNFGWHNRDDNDEDEYYADEDGEYVFVVVDANNCYAFSSGITIEDLGNMTASASDSEDVSCSGNSDGTLTIGVTNGLAPYRYSIDNGVTFSNSPSFVGLAIGTYNVVVQDDSGCEATFAYEIIEPFPLSASSGISKDSTCDTNGAEVRITNVVGGTTPYQYSFNGGTSYGTSSTQTLAPGDYTLLVKDAEECTYSMDITVPRPPEKPEVTADIVYNCDGTANVTLNTDVTTYNYTFERDGTANSPDPTSNVFTNVAAGTYTFTTNYISQTPPDPSLLLSEDFGSGNTIPSPNTSGYFYENQLDDTTPSGAPIDNGRQINDYEYAVTSSIERPFGSWINPIDHTSGTNTSQGRYLVINIGAPNPGQIIYKKAINDIIANQPLQISLWGINLIQSGRNSVRPNLTIELRLPNSTTVVASTTTGAIPENEIWNEYTMALNPGTNTSLDFVIITNESEIGGNDVAIDDIKVFQIPETCSLSVDTAITIESGKAFSAEKTAAAEISCNGAADGSISFEVENFNATEGFEYSIDGGSTWTASTTSPVTTLASLGPGTRTVQIRKKDDTSCTASVSHEFTNPTAVTASADLTTEITCTNSGATITAEASGGMPGYEYQLENTSGAAITGFDFATNGFNRIFTELAAGDYIVRIRDNNQCEDVIDAAITVAAPTTVTFTATPTACYSGNNDAQIQVSVTAGNGTYQFKLNGGTWVTPSPTTATSHTFTNLASGTYTLDVKDGYGCTATQQSVTIEPKFNATVDVTDISSCDDGAIEVTATGGDGNYVYAFVDSGDTVSASDFGTSNTHTITTGNDGDYDVYVRDNNGTSPFCEYSETVTVDPATALTFNATPTAPECHDGKGSVAVSITSGIAPYTVALTGPTNLTRNNVTGTSVTFYDVDVGNYTVTITDASGCSEDETPITVTNPTELTATVDGVTPATCTGDPDDFGFKFTGYPTSLGTLEFSDDGGTTWYDSTDDQDTDPNTFTLTGYVSGNTVQPAIRTVNGSGNTICVTTLPDFIIPYPLDDLDITIETVVVNCNELRVTVQGQEGTPGYDYAFSEDPANFDPATATWNAGGNVDNESNPVTPGHGMFQWTGLTPGRTYVFYVRDDANCVRQSNVNVNDITTNPIDITASFEPSCNGADDGEITFSLTDNQAPAQPQMRWELFEVGNATAVETSGGNVAWSNTITVTGLEPGDYYIEVTEVDAGGTDVCESGSENVAIKELEALGGTPEVMEAISCASPGVIQIKTPSGGGGEYSYTLSSTNFVADITSDGRTIEVPISNLVDATSTPTTVTITVEDQYGCTGNLGNVSIAISQNPSIDSVAVQNCSVPFKVTVTASGGTTPYLYSLDGGASYTNSNVFNNVAVGSHDVVVLDGKGCSSTTTVTVHPALEASVEQTKLIDCVTSPNGQITLEVLKGSSGTGTANYEFEIDGPGTNDVAQTALTSNPFVWGGAATAGTYTVTIYDTGTSGPECSRSFDIVVPAAVEPSFGESHEDVSCNGASDGSITLNETDNGINPLTYSISPSPTGVTFNNTTKTFENLPAGTYIVTGRGTNGCETSLLGITIAEPNAITVPNPTVVDFACTAGNNPNNATITVDGTSITGGSGTYVRYEFIKDGSPDQVVQDGPNASYIETNFAGGDYTINVYDEKGCIGSTTATIDAFVEISDPVVSVTSDVTCNPGSDEAIQLSATVNPTTATPNLEFEVTGLGVTYNQTNTTGTFTGLGVGNYHVAITNTDTGCVIETTHQVEDPKTISVDATKLTDELCLNNGTDDGSFEVTISDYTGNYSYQVYDSEDNAITGQSGTGNTSTGLTVTGLPGGSYYVEITETAAPFCVEKSNLITINAPESAISATAEEEHSPSCSNDQGIILVDPEGGEGPYTIQLTNTTTTDSYTQNNVSAYVFEGLAAGSYNITITDALGCGFFEANKITLVRPDAISASIDASTLSCYNAANASITTNVDNRNVSPVYQYQLNTYTDASGSTLLTTSVKQDANSFGSLTSGFYSVTITDDVGCSFETAIEEIVNPEQVSAQLNLANALTCQSGVELLLSATGGSGSYEYSADGTTYTSMTGNSVSLPLTGTLGAGTYQYYVRDAANGCEAIQSNAITEDAIAPLSLTVDKTAATINCNGDNTAIIYADADGGLGDYQYELYSDASLSPAARIAGPLDQGVFPNLTAGTYYVTVVSGDCTTNAEEVIITEPTELTYSDEVVNVSCLGEEDGSITVTLSGGSGGYQYAISPNLDKFDEENTFTDLAAGEYTIIAQDGNGCFIKLEYEITEPTLLEVSGSAIPEICTGSEDGTITIEITGGTAPYSSAINSNADADFVEGRTEFDNLPAGDHVILVRDANGCEANTVITVDAGVNLNATVEPVYECTGNLPDNRLAITLEDESVEGSIMYALDSTDSADMQLEPNFTNIAPGNHYLAIAHENGCIRTFHFDITAFEPLALSLEQRNLNEITAIATGGVSEYTFYFDGINNGNDNTFRIIETKTYEVRVVDQNGCEVVSEIFMEFIDLEIPNFFSPNGDGQNDVWIPENIEAFPEILIKIFDRYGRAIYDIRVDDAGWDGTYDLEGLPSGDYWYVIKLNGERDKREFVGHFNLYR